MTVKELAENVQYAEEALRILKAELAKAEEEAEVLYGSGMRFARVAWHEAPSKESYIFAQTDEGKVALISIETGNRWSNSKFSKAYRLTEKEFSDLFGSGWVLVNR